MPKTSVGRCIINVRNVEPQPTGQDDLPCRGLFAGYGYNFIFMAPFKYGTQHGLAGGTGRGGAMAIARRIDAAGRVIRIGMGVRVNRPNNTGDGCSGGYNGQYCQSGGEYSVGNPDLRCRLFRRDTTTSVNVLRFGTLLDTSNVVPNVTDLGLSGEFAWYVFPGRPQVALGDRVIFLIEGAPGSTAGYVASNHHNSENHLWNAGGYWEYPYRCGPYRDGWHSIWAQNGTGGWICPAGTGNVVPNDDQCVIEMELSSSKRVYIGKPLGPRVADSHGFTAAGGLLQGQRRARLRLQYPVSFTTSHVGICAYRTTGHSLPLLAQLKGDSITIEANIPASQFDIGRPDGATNPDSFARWGRAPLAHTMQGLKNYELEFSSAGGYMIFADPESESGNLPLHRDLLKGPGAGGFSVAEFSTNGGGTWNAFTRNMVAFRCGLEGRALGI